MPARTPTPLSDEEALSEAAARRLQAEFDALDEVRQPDATYQECLLGAPESGPWDHDEPWGTLGGRRGGPALPERFGLGGGLRAAAAAAEDLLRGGGNPFEGSHEAAVDEPVSDAELARRLQEEERRRARRLRQELPILRSEEGPQEGPQRTMSIPVEHDPLGLEAVAPGTAARRIQSPISSLPAGPHHASPDVVEVPPPHQPASDVAAAAAAAGIQVDADEAVLQAAIAQSLVDM